MKRKYNYTWLNEGVRTFLRDSIPSVHYFSALLRKNWHEIVGKAMASHSTPMGVYNKVLTVNVDDPIWIQEFTLNKDEIRNNIINFFGDKSLTGVFDSIRFQNGEIKGHLPVKKIKFTGRVDPNTLKKIDETLKNLEDKELKEALRHYFIQSQLKFSEGGIPGSQSVPQFHSKDG